MSDCARCGHLACRSGEPERYPPDCPSLGVKEQDVLDLYADEDDAMLVRAAARVEIRGYCKKTRIEEIMDFARECGFQHLGVAFCIGLRREAAVVVRVLEANGFTVDSVLCKNGSLPKEAIGIADADKLSPGTYEPTCNPIGQARALEKAGTQLNIMLGLCVGHDSLFVKYSAAPVTILAAKDRVLGHNPLAAVYLADSYYRSRLFPPEASK